MHVDLAEHSLLKLGVAQDYLGIMPLSRRLLVLFEVNDMELILLVS